MTLRLPHLLSYVLVRDVTICSVGKAHGMNPQPCPSKFYFAPCILQPTCREYVRIWTQSHIKLAILPLLLNRTRQHYSKISNLN